MLERDGRVAEACDAARGALELAEARGRRRTVERLVRRLEGAAPDDAAAVESTERARQALDSVPTVVAPVEVSAPIPSP